MTDHQYLYDDNGDLVATTDFTRPEVPGEERPDEPMRTPEGRRLARPVTSGHPFVDSGRTRRNGRYHYRVCGVCDGNDTGAIHDKDFCRKQGWGWIG